MYNLHSSIVILIEWGKNFNKGGVPNLHSSIVILIVDNGNTETITFENLHSSIVILIVFFPFLDFLVFLWLVFLHQIC